jgi:hypothetical protein
MSSFPAVEAILGVRDENLLHLLLPNLEDREKQYQPAVLGHDTRVQQRWATKLNNTQMVERMH